MTVISSFESDQIAAMTVQAGEFGSANTRLLWKYRYQVARTMWVQHPLRSLCRRLLLQRTMRTFAPRFW
jgi:hypothetical protein